MIYIVLPVHNRKTTTEKFVKALLLQTFKEFTLILVDDGSTDGTSEMVLSYLPNSVIIKGGGSLWWAGGLHMGYKWILKNTSKNDICLFINDDTVFDKYFLKTGGEVILMHDKTLLLAECFSQNTGLLIEKGVKFNYKKLTFTRTKNHTDINCLSTRGLFLKVSDLKAIGGFYPTILPHYLSDYEFTIRAFNYGFKLMTDSRLKLYVDESTTGMHSISYNLLSDYYSKYFSKRNTGNPFSWMAFIILAVPFPYKIYHIIKLSFRFLKDMVKPLIVYIYAKVS